MFDFIINNKVCENKILNNGKNLIQFIHIKDLIKFIINIVQLTKQIYLRKLENLNHYENDYLKLITQVNSKIQK